MKKTLIALAALAVVSAASAQSSVTIYGIVDMGVAQLKDSTATGTYVKNGVQQGTMSNSRIGFKGTEDLGGGLKANFVAELGFAPDETNGYQTMVNRQSTVGLSGNFGAMTIGRQYTPYFVLQNTMDLAGNLNATPGYVVNAHFPDGGRVSNSVQYASPSFGGFTGIVQVGAGSVGTATAPVTTTASNSTEALNNGAPAGKNFGLAGIYAAGPLVAGLAYNDITNPNNSATSFGLNNITSTTNVVAFGQNANEVKTWAAGASYDFSVVKASLEYSSLTQNNTTTADLTSKGWNASIAAPLGAVTLVGNLGRANYETTGFDATITGVQLMANYSLSKRTTAYAVAGRDKTENYGNELIVRTSTAVGIRHSF